MKIILLIALFASFAYGQVTQTQLKARIDALKNDGNFKLSYDKFTDNSLVILKPYNLIGKRSQLAGEIIAKDTSHNGSPLIFGKKSASNIVFSMSLAAGFPFKGEKLTETPTVFMFTLTTGSNEWQFLKERTIYFLVDGERLSMDAVDRSSSIGRGTVAETLSFLVPADTISNIANAKKVEIKAGQTEKVIKSEFFGLLKDLLALGKV